MYHSHALDAKKTTDLQMITNNIFEVDASDVLQAYEEPTKPYSVEFTALELCKKCQQRRRRTCLGCKGKFDVAIVSSVDDHSCICRDCQSTCAQCPRITLKTLKYCKDCLNQRAVQCKSCNKKFHPEESSSTHYYCSSCYDLRMKRCRTCADRIHPKDFLQFMSLSFEPCQECRKRCDNTLSYLINRMGYITLTRDSSNELHHPGAHLGAKWNHEQKEWRVYDLRAAADCAKWIDDYQLRALVLEAHCKEQTLANSSRQHGPHKKEETQFVSKVERNATRHWAENSR